MLKHRGWWSLKLIIFNLNERENSGNHFYAQLNVEKLFNCFQDKKDCLLSTDIWLIRHIFRVNPNFQTFFLLPLIDDVKAKTRWKSLIESYTSRNYFAHSKIKWFCHVMKTIIPLREAQIISTSQQVTSKEWKLINKRFEFVWSANVVSICRNLITSWFSIKQT